MRNTQCKLEFANTDTINDWTEGGKCLQGDCTPSHKCDWFGYEVCSIETCSKWSPAANAIVSRTDEFQYKNEKDGSKGRTATEGSDTIDSADKAKAGSTKYVEDIAVDEAELAADLKEAAALKMQTLAAPGAFTNRVDEVWPV